VEKTYPQTMQEPNELGYTMLLAILAVPFAQALLKGLFSFNPLG
jgi:hypothetical protein